MLNFLFASKKIIRTTESQRAVDLQSKNLSLYSMSRCPFCFIVQNKIKSLGLNIRLKNIKGNGELYNELIQKGGRSSVPCLKIEDKEKDIWLYESSDINAYLEGRFGTQVKR